MVHAFMPYAIVGKPRGAAMRPALLEVISWANGLLMGGQRLLSVTLQ